MIRAVSLTLAAALCLAAAPPESRLEQSLRLRKEAGAAAQANDIAKAETLLEEALALYPTNPGALLRLARVEVAVGKLDEATAHMAAFAELGLTWDIAGDKALSALLAHAPFAAVLAKLTANAQPPAGLGPPTELAVLGRPGDIYEGLAFHNGDWFVSSVTRHTILRVRGGQPQPFLKADAETGGLFGLALDADRGVLWAAEASGPDIPGARAGATGSALLEIDLETGAIRGRFPAVGAGQLGDVVVGPDGVVYASDSVGAGLWRLPPNGKAMERFVTSAELRSPQGLAMCDRYSLVVADYSSGLHRLDLTTGALEAIGGVPTALAGSDGFFAVTDRRSAPTAKAGRLFMATQNGVSPERLLSVRLAPDCRTVTETHVLAANTPGVGDLTLGVASPGWIAFIAKGGWAGFGADGKPLKDAAPEAPRILAIERPTDH